ICSCRQSSRSTAYDGNLLVSLCHLGHLLIFFLLHHVVCCKSLQPANSYRLSLSTQNALGFTLLLLRTNSPTDSRKIVRFFYYSQSLFNIPIGNTFYKMGNLYVHRTSLYTQRLFALKT